MHSLFEESELHQLFEESRLGATSLASSLDEFILALFESFVVSFAGTYHSELCLSLVELYGMSFQSD